MLCERCMTVFNQPKFSRYSSFSYSLATVEKDYNIHHADFVSFWEALQGSCAFCCRLLSQFVSLRKRVAEGKFLREDGTLLLDVDPATFSMNYRMAFETERRSVISFSSLIRANKSGKASKQKATLFLYLAGEQRQLKLSHFPSSENGVNSSTIGIISSLVSECRGQHKSCRREGWLGQPRRFARILDVGDVQDSPTIHLCLNDDLPEDVRYVTLSYCWGGAEMPVLSKNNYEQYLKSILIRELPQTFIDAVHLTRRLGIRYLWIDALCIIQDSESDWQDQAGVMGEVYRSSFLNIAATRGVNPNAGLFVQRSSVLVTPLRVAVGSPDPEPTETYYDVGDESDKWARQILASTLCTRGWIVQERLLAPRVVHFGKEQIFWECVENRTCEESAYGTLSGFRHERADFKKWDPFADSIVELPGRKKLRLNYVWSSVKAMYGRESTEFTKNALKNDVQAFARAKAACYGDENWTKTHPLLLYWTRILEVYTRAKLTYNSDRLVAIAGLAKILSVRTGIRYIAGHWLHQTPRQLLWAFSKIPQVDQNEQYIAPSWSWASVTGGEGIGHTRLDPIVEANGAMDLIKILDVEVSGVRDEEEPMGQVKGGKLRVRGRLLPISLDLSKWPEGCSRKDMLVQYWQGSRQDPPENETFLVPIIFTRWNEKLPSSFANALILEAQETKGTYRRIGTARLSNLCTLRDVVPQLYTSASRYHEDSDDDATSDGDGDDDDDDNEDLPNPSTNKNRPDDHTRISPQEELHKKRISVLTSPQMKSNLERVRKKLGSSPSPSSSSSSSSAPNAMAAAGAANLLSRLEREIDRMPGRPPDLLRRTEADRVAAERDLRDHMSAQWGREVDITVVYRRNPHVRREVPRRHPRDAVAPHFYLDYLQDDEHSVRRYGNFVFDIV